MVRNSEKPTPSYLIVFPEKNLYSNSILSFSVVQVSPLSKSKRNWIPMHCGQNKHTSCKQKPTTPQPFLTQAIPRTPNMRSFCWSYQIESTYGAASPKQASTAHPTIPSRQPRYSSRTFTTQQQHKKPLTQWPSSGSWNNGFLICFTAKTHKNNCYTPAQNWMIPISFHFSSRQIPSNTRWLKAHDRLRWV